MQPLSRSQSLPGPYITPPGTYHAPPSSYPAPPGTAQPPPGSYLVHHGTGQSTPGFYCTPPGTQTYPSAPYGSDYLSGYPAAEETYPTPPSYVPGSALQSLQARQDKMEKEDHI